MKQVAPYDSRTDKFRDLTLYKRGLRGKVLFWKVEVEDDRLRVVHGTMGGAVCETKWRKIAPRHKGERWEISGHTSAVRKAFSMQTRMLEQENYHIDPKLIDTRRFFAPMLAKEYSPKKVQTSTGLTFVQPKIDGIRAVATINGLFSRRGKKFACTSHIEEALIEVFEEWPDLVLDGELYDPDYPDDFGAIQSLVMKSKIDAGHAIELQKRLKFFIFDCAGDCGDRAFDLRHGISSQIAEELFLLGHPIRPVETHIAQGVKEIDKWNQHFLQQGWEGTMVRLSPPNSVYECKRSGLLLKKKEFYSKEFKVVRLIEGEGNYEGCAKAVLLKAPNMRDRFKAGVRGNQTFLRELWTERELYKSGEATVRFQQFSRQGIPRFPVAVALFPNSRTI